MDKSHLGDLWLIAAARHPILWLAVLKHILSIVFLVACTAIMLKATPSEEILAGIYMAKSASPLVFGTFALLNALALAAMLQPRKSAKVAGPTIAHLRRSRTRRFFSHDVTLMAFQTIETTIQVLQAYRLSLYCVDISIATAYALVISVACLGIPWLFFSTHSFVKTTLVLFFNSFVSFVLTIGFALTRFLPPLLTAHFHDKRTEYSLLWMTRYLSLTRFMFPISAMELVAKSILLASSLVNLRRLVAHVRRTTALRRGSVMSLSGLSMRKTSFVALVQVKRTLRFRRQRAQQVFFVAQQLVGAAILSNVLYIHAVRPRCPHGCALETAPWFQAQCTCRYLVINCKDGHNHEASSLLSTRTWGADLFMLHFVQCPLPNGIDVGTLAPFPSLFGLVLESSHLTNWLFNGSFWPASLLLLESRYSNLSLVPEVFYTLPPRLQVLTLRGNHVRHLPETLVSHWQSVSMLLLSETYLSSVPESFLQLDRLERLDLGSNRFTTIPTAWATALPALTRLEMANNNITEFPTNLLQSKPEMLVDLSNTHIDSVPPSLQADVASRRVLLDGTPYCASTSAAGCASVCATTCSTLQWGDNVCHVGCNEPSACGGDGGDCSALVST
ncbi:hypothetical protein SDRG_05530 [Saprolegnia diclina VS20]|uniref:LNR domain-containing protein n=1 Tax=Saprolegnia diclina (strain VS20) TaxID=1156394 RepID=T0QH64_SAPDV|nr:hypothetical protein SDRG_05530 [Saprolegnia diclina VS20]EQC37309.1 hypothetical protein SDRG_05530 [Saprolegnia diclina VS20]|eukprot:XP_008609471.1 hypothetical protein SDRG_05530 [Saprolegnia diclina VS20]